MKVKGRVKVYSVKNMEFCEYIKSVASAFKAKQM